MAFKMKYEVKADYIAKGKRRPGTFITPKFGVLHDTGNPGSTAKNNRDYYNNTPNHETAASAHTFIDHTAILECVPATTGKPERAHHVRYQRPEDNALFGDDANDIAIGVELCFGGKIDFEEAYKRYVWYCAYVSYKFGFSPTKWIGHEKLDPGRKTDPTNALKRYGKSYGQLLADILKEYAECMESEEVASLDVKKLQNDLLKAGEKLPKYGVDGDLGTETASAIKSFQSKHGLTVDGIPGTKMLAKLAEVLKPAEKPKPEPARKQVRVIIETNNVNAAKIADEYIKRGYDVCIEEAE